MAIDVIKQQMTGILSDVGVVGWLVLGIYAALFGVKVILSIREFNIKKRNRNRRAREKEIRRLRSDISYSRRMRFYEARTNYYNRRARLYSGRRGRW